MNVLIYIKDDDLINLKQQEERCKAVCVWKSWNQFMTVIENKRENVELNQIINWLDTEDETLIEIDIILLFTINIFNYETTLEMLNHTDSWKSNGKYLASCIESIDNSIPIGQWNLPFFYAYKLFRKEIKYELIITHKSNEIQQFLKTLGCALNILK